MTKLSGMVTGLNRESSKEDAARHAQSMYQLEELKAGEEQHYTSNPNIVHYTQQNESNDASFIVPEHHIREQKLK